MTDEYKNSLSEVSIALKSLSTDIRNKIPKSLLNFIEENKSKGYIPKFDIELPLSKQNLMKETKVILSLIYRSYLCDEETRRKLKIDDIIEIKTKQIELNNKHIYENLFKRSK